MRLIAPSLLLLVLGAACKNAADPPSCGGSPASFSSTTPNFSATVSQVTHETGLSPEGPMNQYALWLAVSPATTSTAGVVLLPSTPVFQRWPDGSLTPTTACAISVGDQLDVWHDWRWAYGAAEAPPGDTLYFGTQVVVHR
jgi:hypothetical protein